MSFMLHQLVVVLVLLPTLSGARCSKNNTVYFHIGVILDLDSLVGHIGNMSLSLALLEFYSSHSNYTTRLVPHIMDSKGSVIDAASAAIDLLRDVEVDAIIGPQKSTQVNFVMDIGDRAHVPILSFSATSPALIPQTPYFVRTAQSDAYQVGASASIVKHFSWSQVVIISEDTEYGSGIIPDLSNALQDVNARVSYRSLFPKSASDDFISKELYKMMGMQTRVFVVHMTDTLGAKLFLKAKEIVMMSDGYAWIVTSGLTDLYSMMDIHVIESMQGVLGVKPVVPESKELGSFAATWRNYLGLYDDIVATHVSIYALWAYDTLSALAMAAERVGNGWFNFADVDSSTVFDLPVSKTGAELLREVLGIKFFGLAGMFSLTNGQLKQTPYEIVNFVGRGERKVGVWSPYNGISQEVNQTHQSFWKRKTMDITWPGGSKIVPKGWEFPVSGTKLRIGVAEKSGFNDFLKVDRDPETNATKVHGYFKEVFEEVMAALPYAVRYEYVTYPFEKSDGTSAGSYNDLIFQVSRQNYDAALGDITITANLSTYVDFSLPYADGGVASIVPIKYENPHDKWTFLEPLTKELWTMSALFYIFTGLSIWILAKRFNSCRETAGQHAGMICYFPLFPGHGIGGTLICLILVTWAFVACLLISTYTASLSSRLTVQRLLPTVEDVKQLIKMGDYVGCQQGSFLVEFLVGQGFEESKIRTYRNTEDCHEALSKGSKNGGISAYFDVLPHIAPFLSQFCGQYRIVGPTYRTDGFGLAFPKMSPLVSQISRAIIQLTEAGTILDIGEMNSAKKTCAGQDTAINPSSVTLRSFQVLFSITGSVTMLCLIVSFLMYLYQDTDIIGQISEFFINIGSKIHTSYIDLKGTLASLTLLLREKLSQA